MSSVFEPPLQPKNGFELLKWGFFEPVLLVRFEKTISRIESIKWFIKAYFLFVVIIVPLILILRTFIVSYIAQTDLPLLYQTEFKEDIVTFWQTHVAQPNAKFWFLFFYKLEDVAFGLAEGLAFSLAYGLTGGLAFSLAFGLAFSLAGGLAFNLAEGLAFSLAGGLAGSLALGFALGLAVGLALGLAYGLVAGLAGSLALGLAFMVAWYLAYFRLIFYPFHWFSSFFNYSLTKNPYVSDGVIWLPIWGLTTKLS